MLLADVQSENALRRGLSNEGKAIARLVPEIPLSIASTLADDWQNHRSVMLKKAALATGIGIGSAVLLARSPVLARGLMGVLGAGAAAGALGFSGNFLISAWNANTELERDALIRDSAGDLGRVGADLIETAPGLLVGTRVGLGLTNRIPTLESLSLRVRHGLDFKVRTMVPESIHYAGPGTRSVAAAHGDGCFDLLRASEEIARQNPWRGVEEGRFFTAGRGRIKFSSTLPGTADEVIMGRRAQNMFHTHENKILPTSGDFNSVRGTGVISTPGTGTITFFEGTSLEAENALALARAGKTVEAQQALQALHGRTFRSLVVDSERQLALRIDSRWNPSIGLEPVSATAVEFAEAAAHLRNWNGLNLELAALRPSTSALLRPGATRLLSRVLTGG